MSKEELKSIKSSSPVGRIFDLPELLSPMLVKELRQGLRSVGFTGLFIGMQALLGFIILMMLISGADTEPVAVSAAIFYIFIITSCIIQPLRGFNAISAEITGDTIDLVIITRLTSWKIVFGKWVALMSQSLIFFVSLLPYLILRYFLGDMMLFNELYLFTLIFIFGCVTTAIAVGASAISTAILRILISGSLITAIVMFTFGLISSTLAARSVFYSFFGPSIPLLTYFYVSLAVIIVAAYLSWMFLDFGASIIAPLSENRATLRRKIYLLLLTIGVVASLLIKNSMASTSPMLALPLLMAIQVILITLFVPFFITTFTEHEYLSPRIVIAVKKRPIISRFRNIFYPGWAPGSIFLALCIIIHVAMIAILDFNDSKSFRSFDRDSLTAFYAFITSLIGSLVFPAACLSLFARNVVNRLGIYLIILICSFIITLIVTIFSQTLNSDMANFFCWLPSVNLSSYRHTGFDNNKTWVGVLNSALIIIYMLVIFLRSAQSWKHIKNQESYAKNSLAKNPGSEKA